MNSAANIQIGLATLALDAPLRDPEDIPPDWESRTFRGRMTMDDAQAVYDIARGAWSAAVSNTSKKPTAVELRIDGEPVWSVLIATITTLALEPHDGPVLAVTVRVIRLFPAARVAWGGGEGGDA